MKILLNLLAVSQGGQVTRASEFIKRFKFYSSKNDSLVILISDKYPIKTKNERSIRYVKIKFLYKRLNWLIRLVWENTYLIYFIKNLKPDIFLTFSHSLPLFKVKVPTIVGLSNLAPFSNLVFKKDTLTGKIRLLLLKYIIKHGTTKATAVIALSNYGKKILIKNNIKKNKIYEISIGVKKQKKKLINHRLIRLKKKYILYVSHFYNYKNFEQLILAYSKLPKQIKLNFRLKLVGNFSDEKYVESLRKLSKELRIEHLIDFISSLQGEALNKLYKNASLFVFPSRIENSPNILLEAMSFSLPVLVVKTEPMPEFAGNAAKYFKLDDEFDLSKKINLILTSNLLLNKLSKRSYVRSRQYSWNLFTKKVINLSRQIYLKNKKI